MAEIIGVAVDALHSYRVRFSDGGEASLRRKEFALLSTYKTDETGLPDPLDERDRDSYHKAIGAHRK